MATYDAEANRPKDTPDQDGGGQAGKDQGSDGTGKTPSGHRGDNPATAGPGPTEVTSETPENRAGHLNPSAPEDSNATPGSTTVK